MIDLADAERRIEALEEGLRKNTGADPYLLARIKALEEPQQREYGSWRGRARTAEARVQELEAELAAVKFGGDWLSIDFLAAMERQMEAGAARPGRKRDDWREKGRPYVVKCAQAIERHIEAMRCGDSQDDTGEPHWIAIACNAMMAHVLLQEEGKG